MKWKCYAAILLSAGLAVSAPAAAMAQEMAAGQAVNLTKETKADESTLSDPGAEISDAQDDGITESVSDADEASDAAIKGTGDAAAGKAVVADGANEEEQVGKTGAEKETIKLKTAAQEEVKEISFVEAGAVEKDGVITRTVSEGNGSYVIIYGDDDNPIKDAADKKITASYVKKLIKELNEGLSKEKKEISSDYQVREILEISYQVAGVEKSLGSPRYLKLAAEDIKEDDKAVILHQTEKDGEAAWEMLEDTACGDGWIGATFESFSPVIVLTASADAATSADEDTDSGNTDDTVKASTSAEDGTDSSGDDTTSDDESSGTTDNTDAEHVHTMSHVEAKQATETQHGNIAYYYCEECEKMFSDENGTTEITDVIEHYWGLWTITKNATETEAGSQERTCSVCGEKETKEIPAGTNMATYNPNADNQNLAGGNVAQNPVNSTAGTVTPNTVNNTAGTVAATPAATATTATTAANGVNTPKTGDRAGIPAACGVLIAAVAALAGIGIAGKRRKLS